MEVQYLALGDSYTIGTAASSPRAAFPSALARKLGHSSGVLVSVVNLGVNGYTSADVVRHELPAAKRIEPTFTSVLVGVNDYVQRRSQSSYLEDLRRIYDAVAGRGDSVIAVSIPDFSYTPAASSFGTPEAIREGLQELNALAAQEAAARTFTWIDIFEVSRSGIGSPGWIADDGLHPGDLQHQAWADHIWALVGREWTEVAERAAQEVTRQP